MNAAQSANFYIQTFPQMESSCSPLGDSPENLRKLSANRKPLPSRKLDGKASIPHRVITIKIV